MSDADWAGRRWVVLVAGMLAMTAGCTFQYGLAYLIPAFRAEGLSLEQASILVACPTAGLLLTLVAWGAAADRWGERLVLGAGLALAGAILLAGSTVHGPGPLGVCLALAGAAGASVYAASGRLILGWFPARQRGLAMGIRQSAQPLGVMVAALVLPALGAVSRAAALVFLGTFCLAAALLVAVAVRDPARPPRPARAARPARRTGVGRAGCCGGSTRPARCSSCRSSRWPRSRWCSWLTSMAWPPLPRAGCSRWRRPAARPAGSAPGPGPTGWAAGCARCGCWPWLSR